MGRATGIREARIRGVGGWGLPPFLFEQASRDRSAIPTGSGLLCLSPFYFTLIYTVSSGYFSSDIYGVLLKFVFIAYGPLNLGFLVWNMIIFGYAWVD